MPKKGKEPAGLRRYRLAQKRKKSKRRKTPARAAPRKRRAKSMARRRGSRRKSKPSMALLPMAPVAMVMYKAYKDGGDLEGFANLAVGRTTGYYPKTGAFTTEAAKMFWFGEVAAIIGHKVANKVGINKSIRRMTGGWVSL